MDNERLLAEITSVRLKYSRAIYDLEQLKEKVKTLEEENQDLLQSKINQKKSDGCTMQANKFGDENVESFEKQVSELKIQNNSLQARLKQTEAGMNQNKQFNLQQSAEKKEENYEVEKLLDHKEERLFLVRWKGYGPEDDTWEAESNLHCPKMLRAYLKKNKI